MQGSLSTRPLDSLVSDWGPIGSLGAARITVVVCSLLMATIILLLHKFVSPVIYDFTGNLQVDRSVEDLVLLTVLATLPSIWLPVRTDRPSIVAVWSIYLAIYVPTVVVAPQVYAADLGTFGSFFLVMFLSMVGLAIPYRFPAAAIRRPGINGSWLVVILATACVLWFLYSLATVELRFGFTAQEDLYDERFLIRDQLALSGEHLWQYLTKWTSDIVLPALVAVGFFSRRYLAVFIGVALAFVLAASEAARGPLVAIGFVVGMPFLIVRDAAGRFAISVVRIVVSVLSGTGFLMLWDLLVGKADAVFPMTHLIFMRLFVVPGILSGYYYDFYSNNPLALYGESVLGWLFGGRGVYSDAVALMIGRNFIYDRDTATVANASIWADGYANLGLAGVAASTLVVGFLFYVVDRLAAGRDFRIVAAMIAALGMNLANSGIQTAFVTGGFWLLLVVVWLLPEANNAEYGRLASNPSRIPDGG